MDLSVVGTILTEQVHEALDDVAREVLGTDGATRGDRGAHLIQVGRARVALSKVLLEAASVPTRQGAVEIVAHQFDGVATHRGCRSHRAPRPRALSCRGASRRRP